MCDIARSMDLGVAPPPAPRLRPAPAPVALEPFPLLEEEDAASFTIVAEPAEICIAPKAPRPHPAPDPVLGGVDFLLTAAWVPDVWDPAAVPGLDALSFMLPPAAVEDEEVSTGAWIPMDPPLPTDESAEGHPRAPRLRPAADPDVALPPLMLPPGAHPDVEGRHAPSAPRLRPAADPELAVPPLTLPPAASASECTGACRSAPPAPRLRPAADPVCAAEIPALSLPPAVMSENSQVEAGTLGLAAAALGKLGCLADDVEHRLTSAGAPEISQERLLARAVRRSLEEVGCAPSPLLARSFPGAPGCAWAPASSACSTEASTPRRLAVE